MYAHLIEQGPKALLAGLLFVLMVLGWGYGLVKMVFRKPANLDSALAPGLGIAVTLIFAALMVLVVRRPMAEFWAGWMLLGALAGAVIVLRSAFHFVINASSYRLPVLDFILLALSASFLFFDSFNELFNYYGNCWDDITAYWAQVRRILERGSLEDLFSFRRIASFGGQQLLQSFYVLNAPINFLNFFDRGVCKLLLYVLGYLFLRNRKVSVWNGKSFFIAPFILFFCLVDVEVPDANSAALYLPCVLLLTYFILRVRSWEEPHAATPYLLGFLLGSVMYFRANYLVGCGLIVLFEGVPILFGPGKRASLHFFIKLCGVFGLTMLPGMVLLWQAAATPFWPLIQGSYSSAYKSFNYPVAPEILKLYWTYLLLHKTMLISVVAFLFSLFSFRQRPVFCAASLSSMVSIVAVGYATQGSQDGGSVIRYCFPFYVLTLMVFSYQVVERVYDRWPNWSSLKHDYLNLSSTRRIVATALIGISILEVSREIYYRQKFKFIVHVVPQMRKDGRLVENLGALDRQYKALSERLPRDKRILVGVEHPYLLSFKQNEYLLIDWPGMVSPQGKLNFQNSFSTIDQYLQEQNIDYLLFEDPNQCQCAYSAEVVEAVFTDKSGKKSLFTEWAGIYKSYFSYLEYKRKDPTTLKYGPFYWVKVKD